MTSKVKININITRIACGLACERRDSHHSILTSKKLKELKNQQLFYDPSEE